MSKNSPFDNGCTIRCCTNCVPPKRHVGCHATCKDYITEKADWEAKKKLIAKDKAKSQRISNYDFEKVSHIDFQGRKK